MKLHPLVLALGLLPLAGCGGGDSSDNSDSSSDPTPYAYYVDASVAGINYVCGSKTGTTDQDGKFFFDSGESCTFSIGTITLKTISSDVMNELKSGETVQETDTVIAQILQNLDDDGDLTNGIRISVDPNSTSTTKTKAEAFVTAMEAAEISNLSDVDLSDVSAETTQAVINSVITVVNDAGDTFITADDAATHLFNTILSDSKGLLDVGYDGDLTYGSVKLLADDNGDLTSATYTDQLGSNNSSATVSLETSDGVTTLTIVEGSETTAFSLKLVNTDSSFYIEMTDTTDSSHIERLYPLADKSAAETFLIGQRLSSNTLYAVDATNQSMESWAFNQDLSSAEWVNSNDGESGTTSVTFKDLVMTASDATDGTITTITFTGITGDYLSFSYEYTEDGVNVSGSGRLYFMQEDAATYLTSLTESSDVLEITNTMISGQTWYTRDFYKISFGTNYTLTSTNMLNPEEEDGSQAQSYVINNGQLIVSGETTINLVSADTDSYIIKVTEDGETYEETIYTNLSALEASMMSDLSSEKKVIDNTDDSTNNAHAGFELLSVSALETTDNKLQITVTANGNIQDALATAAPMDYSHILWIGINDSLEFGMDSNGSPWVMTDYWLDGNYVDGTPVSTDYYSYTISGNTVTFTIDADQIPANDFGYLYIHASIGQDYNGDAEEESDDFNYDEVSLVAKWTAPQS